MQEVKTCYKCNKSYPPTNLFFSNDKQKKDGLRTYCKSCDRIRNKQTYSNTETLVKEKRKIKREEYLKSDEYRFKKIKSKNRDRIRKRRWVLNNKEKIKEGSRLYRDSGKRIPPTKEKIRQYKKTAYDKTMSDPYKKLVHYYRARMNRILKGKDKLFKSGDIILFSKESLIDHIESLFKEGMSWDNYGSWHIDHIKPISSFNLKDREDMIACWSLNNLQPLWAIENLKKGSFWTQEQKR